MDLGHPFYGWYTLYSASVPRPFRAWCCGFEILVFMYALAFETNLLFPDVEEECAARLTRETCASLKTALRGKFKGTHVESAPLCQWMPCAEACVMEEPGEDEMSPMSAARRPERGPARRDDGAGSGTPVKGVPPPVVDAGDPVTDEEALEILEIRERAGGGGEARASVSALDADALQGVPLDAERARR
ncbi:hypothetical protein JL721_7905 [Aureococcus anophagefferens]|nr:hypothetical protein JL721_7905 [Aureococcus anophagefferens]